MSEFSIGDVVTLGANACAYWGVREGQLVEVVECYPEKLGYRVDRLKGDPKRGKTFWVKPENMIRVGRLIPASGDAPKEAVDHPSHYQGPNECIDAMRALFGLEAVKHFCACNAYKYRFRAGQKNGAEDIKKAEWYETKLIELGGL